MSYTSPKENCSQKKGRLETGAGRVLRGQCQGPHTWSGHVKTGVEQAEMVEPCACRRGLSLELPEREPAKDSEQSCYMDGCRFKEDGFRASL